MTDLIEITRPKESEKPFIIDIPHSGLQFPDSLKGQFKQNYLDCPEDADWHLEQIYDFAAELGITTLKANYSRYVIDLNRDPSGARLYTDNRSETDAMPVKSFAGQSLYSGQTPDQAERQRRVNLYFTPYYTQLQQEIDRLHSKFGKVLVFDAHSIKHFVPTISDKKFPDFILGNADGKSCRQGTINSMKSLFEKYKHPNQTLSLNSPFKGGNITRHFYDLDRNIETIQLEMCQNLYMNEDNYELHSGAEDLKQMLKKILGQFLRDNETV